MPHRLTIGAILAIGLVVALGFWVWSAGQSAARPNLLLITLDTTRADRLGCYGFPSARTPALDALASGGVLCEEAHTVMPLTLPAHAALFTGRYPAENGMEMNGRGRLDETIETLAELLEGQGYATGAFVASFVLDRKFGLDQGFQVYDDDFAADRQLTDSMQRQRSGAGVVDAALRWLSGQSKAPFFCWVHLYDPHAPYETHAALFGEQFAGRPYDAEIAYADLQVGRLFDFLDHRGLRQETLVVVAGDHGEGLGDHLERTHGSTLYREILRVPLIWRFPDRLSAGRRLETRVSLVDVSPTILDLLGIADSRTKSGQSFRAALEGGEADDGPCYATSNVPLLTNGWSPLQTLTDGRWKYIRTTKPELYDIAADPGERVNLAGQQSELLREMEQRLQEFESGLDVREAVGVPLTEAERQALSSLGYAAGGRQVATAKEGLPDIKDKLKLDNAVEDASDLLVKGDPNGAVVALRGVLREDPGHGKAAWTLATLLLQQREYDDAAEVFLALLAAKPDAGGGHVGLGEVLAAQSRYPQAIAEYRQELAANPDIAYVHDRLAVALAHTGETGPALEHFGKALEIDRGYAPAYRGRGAVLTQLGRPDEALADLRRAVRYDPFDPENLYQLGMLLASRNQLQPAFEYLARAVQLGPADARFRIGLAKMLVTAQRHGEAARQLAEALRLEPDSAEAQQLLKRVQSAARPFEQE
ncbi:MAG TPA: sulfatase-like hydrolase/transferase [Planctomycetaceae bacterium]|nr:sulfatase-like hydrolase/transferase [Planctomycetaceae bacterium]